MGGLIKNFKLQTGGLVRAFTVFLRKCRPMPICNFSTAVSVLFCISMGFLFLGGGCFCFVLGFFCTVVRTPLASPIPPPLYSMILLGVWDFFFFANQPILGTNRKAKAFNRECQNTLYGLINAFFLHRKNHTAVRHRCAQVCVSEDEHSVVTLVVVTVLKTQCAH